MLKNGCRKAAVFVFGRRALLEVAPQLSVIVCPSYVADEAEPDSGAETANEQVESGHYVKHEDMKAWLLSWGSSQQLLLPQCVFGNEHDNEELCRYG